ncbi:predicted protein [Botrytis cinerea T4]|uniref:Uncharacterized protein n=1 Tax=Botryotinia fuckeliana (strain T4) TaxID=999810 RepID=G2YZF2_BOTF4|nr:predicted protein [Botrytis cinerea T4]
MDGVALVGMMRVGLYRHFDFEIIQARQYHTKSWFIVWPVS